MSELEIFVDFLRKGERDDWAPLTSNERLLASIDPSSTVSYDEWKDELLGSPPTMPKFDRKRPGDRSHRRSRSGMSDAPSSSEGGVSSVTGGSPREPKSFVSVTSARNDEEEENESTIFKEEKNEEESSKPEEIQFEKIDPSKTQSVVVTHLGNALKALETKIKVDFACPEEEKKPKPEVVSVYSKCSVKQAISAIVEHCQTNRPDLREILKERNPLRYELVLAFDDFVMESALDFDKPISNFTSASNTMQGFQLQPRTSTPSSAIKTPKEGEYSFDIDLNGIVKGARGLHSPFSLIDMNNKSINVSVRQSPFGPRPTLWNVLAKLQEIEESVQLGYVVVIVRMTLILTDSKQTKQLQVRVRFLRGFRTRSKTRMALRSNEHLSDEHGAGSVEKFGCKEVVFDVESVQGQSFTVQAESCANSQHDRRCDEEFVQTVLGKQQRIEDRKFGQESRKGSSACANGTLHGTVLESLGSCKTRVERDQSESKRARAGTMYRCGHAIYIQSQEERRERFLVVRFGWSKT